MFFRTLLFLLALLCLPQAAWAQAAMRAQALPCPNPVGMGRMVLHGPRQAPLLVAAPHEPFDRHTGALALAVASALGAPCLVAEGYLLEEGRLNVNRPTMGAAMAPEGEAHTLAARAVYRAYLAQVQGVRPQVLLEIHGNSRPASAQRVEVAHRALPEGALQVLREESDAAVAALAVGVPHLPLAIEGLDAIHYRGLAAKSFGVFAEVPVAIQMEFPLLLRSEVAHRQAYAQVVARCMRRVMHLLEHRPG